jgi:hypothetical protein
VSKKREELEMKKLILSGMIFVMTLVSLGGCFIGYDGYGRREGHERGEGHEGGGGHHHDEGHDGGGGHEERH